MKSPKDGQTVEPEPPTTDMEPEPGERPPTGRIIHDERGNAIWKWRGDTSSSGSTSGILKYIEPVDLEVEGQGDGRAPDPGGGYDPYNQGGARNRGVPGKAGRGKLKAG